MQLVGAKAGFIIAPFVKRAGLHGLTAGIIASVMLFALMTYANSVIEELKQLQTLNELLILFGCILAIGLIIAMISTYGAVRKYLRMALDELY